MHVLDCDHEQRTTAAFIAELPGDATKVRDDARMWVTLGSPCVSVRVPVVVGEPLGDIPRWERFAALGPEHRERLDELETWLAAELQPAAEAWREVGATLDQLGV